MRDHDATRALAALLLLGVAGCATYRPNAIEEVPSFLERVQTLSRSGLTVKASVLSNDEAKKIFGVDLAGQRIQPVWLDITNDTDAEFVLLKTPLDPDYFSPREAAYKNHINLRGVTNLRMDDDFDDKAIDGWLSPGDRDSGFVFTNHDYGTKHIYVALFAEKRTETFEFDIPIPGLRFDHHEVEFQTLYTESEITDIQEEEELLAALQALPCCTTRKNGKGKGDPLNLIIVGDDDLVASAFNRTRWDETETTYGGSAWKTFRSALFGGEYRYSPMSALYVYGRSQDMGLQKARASIHERQHLRLWLSPLRWRGVPIFVGTITRDIGVYFTRRAWNLTTHAIDPDVDEARRYVAEDLIISQFVEGIGLVPGVGPASREEPHRNLMEAPWWTNGYRMVFLLTRNPTPVDEVEFFPWEFPSEGADDDEEWEPAPRGLGPAKPQPLPGGP